MSKKMDEHARKLLVECSGLKAGEKVLILTDDGFEQIVCEKLYACAKELGAEPVIIRMPTVTPGGELNPMINAALLEADLIIGATSTSTYHSKGIHEACTAPNHGRLQALSEWKADTLENGGMEADFVAIAPRTLRVCEKMTQGKHLVMTTPGGTHIEADITDRYGADNTGLALEPCVHMGLPTIESFIAPVEDSVNGHITVDASCSGGIGIIKDPIEIEVENGRVVSITGGEEAAKLRRLLESTGTDKSYQLAEIAVGMNPFCRITGNINEDEGKYGTCHCALGNNTAFGGINYAPVHIDMVQWTPTLLIDGEAIFKDGECMIE